MRGRTVTVIFVPLLRDDVDDRVHDDREPVDDVRGHVQGRERDRLVDLEPEVE